MSLFNAVQEKRQNASNATKNYMVRSLTKDGQVSKARLTQADWQFNSATTMEEAETRKADLEALNPGRKFVITSV